MKDAQRAPHRSFELREVVDAEGITVELLVEGERLFFGRGRNVDLAETARMLRLARRMSWSRSAVSWSHASSKSARETLSRPVPASSASGEGDGHRLVSRYVNDGMSS